MFNKFFSTLKRANRGTDFQGYMSEVHRKGVASVPTADEARRDFQASIRMIRM